LNRVSKRYYKLGELFSFDGALEAWNHVFCYYTVSVSTIKILAPNRTGPEAPFLLKRIDKVVKIERSHKTMLSTM
jgi:hypothetical protein